LETIVVSKPEAFSKSDSLINLRPACAQYGSQNSDAEMGFRREKAYACGRSDKVRLSILRNRFQASTAVRFQQASLEVIES
jgi:hypothetical protein